MGCTVSTVFESAGVIGSLNVFSLSVQIFPMVSYCLHGLGSTWKKVCQFWLPSVPIQQATQSSRPLRFLDLSSTVAATQTLQPASSKNACYQSPSVVTTLCNRTVGARSTLTTSWRCTRARIRPASTSSSTRKLRHGRSWCWRWQSLAFMNPAITSAYAK